MMVMPNHFPKVNNEHHEVVSAPGGVISRCEKARSHSYLVHDIGDLGVGSLRASSWILVDDSTSHDSPILVGVATDKSIMVDVDHAGQRPCGNRLGGDYRDCGTPGKTGPRFGAQRARRRYSGAPGAFFCESVRWRLIPISGDGGPVYGYVRVFL